jgi:hypothetical protein
MMMVPGKTAPGRTFLGAEPALPPCRAMQTRGIPSLELLLMGS